MKQENIIAEVSKPLSSSNGSKQKRKTGARKVTYEEVCNDPKLKILKPFLDFQIRNEGKRTIVLSKEIRDHENTIKDIINNILKENPECELNEIFSILLGKLPKIYGTNVIKDVIELAIKHLDGKHTN